MLRSITQLTAGLFAVLTCSAAALAHPGHGVVPSDQPAHWFEPVHAAPIAISVLAIALYAWRRSRSKS